MIIKLNKKLIAIITSFCIFCGLAGTYIALPSKEIRIHSNLVQFDSLDKLRDCADLIVTGSTEKEFSDFKPTITYNSNGRIEDFYTITDVKVDKIYKGSFDKSYVPVSQVAVLDNSFGNIKKDTIIDEHYSIMRTNKKYVLFLKKVENQDFYSIISVYQGKYNIDGLDTDEDKVSSENKTYNKIKKEVKEKYK